MKEARHIKFVVQNNHAMMHAVQRWCVQGHVILKLLEIHDPISQEIEGSTVSSKNCDRFQHLD